MEVVQDGHRFADAVKTLAPRFARFSFIRDECGKWCGKSRVFAPRRTRNQSRTRRPPSRGGDGQRCSCGVGSEKFWSGVGAEALLQLAADHHSETKPLTTFWRERPSRATGQRRYQTAS